MHLYKLGQFHNANEEGIFTQDIDLGEDWFGKVVVYADTKKEAVEKATKIVELLNSEENKQC